MILPQWQSFSFLQNYIKLNVWLYMSLSFLYHFSTVYFKNFKIFFIRIIIIVIIFKQKASWVDIIVIALRGFPQSLHSGSLKFKLCTTAHSVKTHLFVE